MLPKTVKQWGLIVIVLCYIVLGIGFSTGPIMEGPDELEHYHFVDRFLRTNRLPDPRDRAVSQYHQTPLYYVMISPIVELTGPPALPDSEAYANPHFGYEFGVPGHDNKNMYLHSASERFPYRESRLALAVHLARLLNIAFYTGTIIVTAQIAGLLWPDQPERSLLAAGFTAFMPQAVFLSGVLTNDVPLYFFSALALLLVLLLLRDGPSWRLTLLLGLTLGAALLTKASAVYLVFPVGLAFLIDRRNWRAIVPTLGLVCLLAGWWYIGNIIKYGDPTGAGFVLREWGGAINQGAFIPAVGWERLPFAYQTFWARFGNTSIPVGGWMYRFYDILTLLVIAGSLIGIFHWMRNTDFKPDLLSTPVKQRLVLAVFLASWLICLFYWSSIFWSGNQGRYLLYGIAGWAIIFTFAIGSLTPMKYRKIVGVALPAVLAGMTAISLWGYYLPAFQPAPVPEEIEHPLAYRYGDVAELIGIDPVELRARPGDLVQVTLYWRALRSTERNLIVHLHTLEGGWGRSSYPGTGNLLSTSWKAGDTWAGTYLVRIPDDVPEQTLYKWVVRLEDADTGEDLTVTVEGSSETFVARVGQISIYGENASTTTESKYLFGDIIGLGGWEIAQPNDETMQVCMDWESLGVTQVDYTVFVHVFAEQGETILAQSDRQPKDGTYPTSVWMPGEEIEDCQTIGIDQPAAEDLHLAVGFYDSSGIRLPVVDDTGRALENDVVILAEPACCQ